MTHSVVSNAVNGEGEMVISSTIYRAMIGLIVLMVTSAVGMSGWSLMTLNSLSSRLSSVETKLINDAVYHDKTIERIEKTVERSVERLEAKIDKLADSISGKIKT